MRGQWDEGVYVQLEGQARYFIEDTMKAAEILLNRWPTAGGRRYRLARQVCMSVLEGRAAPNRARTAFISAAQEAGILFRPKAQSTTD